MKEAPFAVDAGFSGRQWRLREADDRIAMAHAQRLGVPDILGRVLATRGVALDEGPSFLRPSLRESLPDPSLIAGMDEAAESLAARLMADEPIAVFGDYDVDGATSSALLMRYGRALGRNLRAYIPDRQREGYGPNGPALRRLAEEGARLVVTVDCGTLAHAALAEGRAAGLTLIVCDHHLPGPTLPQDVTVVNPNRADDRSGQGMLAAVGVAFLLCVATNRVLRRAGFFTPERPEPDLRLLLDLVALGTVCDVVPLKGLNRAFVTQGLKIMGGWTNPGLAALAEIAKIKAAPSAQDLGFLLGPRINAGGRIGTSDLGVRLLTTEDPAEAADLARRLDLHNRERQTIEGVIVDAAYEDAQRRGLRTGIAVAAGEDFHPGVIGIVAARLRERAGRPSAVFSLEGEIAKGSARSVQGVDLGGAVHAALAEGLLISGGGHAMAAGMTLKADRLDEVIAFLDRAMAPQMRAMGRDSLWLDAVLRPAAATPDLVDAVAAAGPFGAGNPEPTFAVTDLRVVHADIVGTDHVRVVTAGDDGSRLKAIAFRAASGPVGQGLLRQQGRPLHLAGRLARDDWNGRSQTQLIIEDASPA